MAPRSSSRVGRLLVLVIGPALAASVVAFGCSRHDGEDAVTTPSEEEEPWVPPHRYDAGALDAGPPDGGSYDASDGRAEEELAALLDAGRFCGSRDAHDCPLQGWMKRNANTMFTFGDISSIADVFDRIATFAPQETTDDGGLVYANWASIAHDGASAARSGNMSAVKAACRGCHSQYRTQYHSILRGLALPSAPDASFPTP